MNREEERPPLHRLSGLVLGVALLPGVIGLTTEFWLLGDVTFRHVGLWKTCGDTSCQPLLIDTIPDWYGAVRGMCVMALCLHVISVMTGCCCACLGLQEVESFSFLPRLEEAAAVGAGILMGGGLALFAVCTQTHPVFRNFRFDWSFWLCLAQVCLLLLCGGVIAHTRNNCACRKWRFGKPKDRNIPIQKIKASESFVQSPKGNVYKLCPSFDEENDSIKSVDAPARKSLIKDIFLERLKQSGAVQYFSSLEGIPRTVPTFSGEMKETV